MARKAAFSALALFTARVAAEGLVDVVCQTGAYFDANSILDEDNNMTCDQTLMKFIPQYMNRTTFTADECEAEMMSGEEEGPSSLHQALMYTQMMCCVGAPMSNSGPCGSFFPDGTFCMDDTTFRPGAGAGKYHCEGDEYADEMTCNRAGPGAWDPSEDEMCDVGRLGGTDLEQQMRCEAVGGMWTEQKCMEWHMGFQEQGFFALPVDSMCAELGMMAMYWNMAGAACCKYDDGQPADSHQCTSRAQELVCGAEQFMPDSMLGDTSCSDLMPMFGSLGDRSEFSQGECDLPNMDSDDGTTLRSMVGYVEMYCCSQGGSRYGLCGDKFAEGTVCADSDHFRADAGLGYYHCSGDEEIMSEAECNVAGEGAWDAMAEEKCDVGRVRVGDEGERQELCERVGGTWDDYKCGGHHMYLSMMGMFDDTRYCANPESHPTYQMVGEKCCQMDDGSAAPVKEVHCGGGGSCSRTHVISERSYRMALEKGFKAREC